MRIAVDAMGGDFAPSEIVKGAREAARRLPSVSRIFLVGDEAVVGRELGSDETGKISIHHASEAIGMDETPALAVRRKKDSSIGRAVDLVKAGKADAVVSAGNTGAVVVAATLKLRTLTGVERPAIAIVMPTRSGPFILIDAGANIDCGPKLLAQFAVMGSAYSQVIFSHENPSVGLLSIGGEDTKGNETTREAFKLLNQSPLNFTGNVEGHDIFEGKTDVVVCDGFVGNIVLKTSESVAAAVFHWVKEEVRRNPIRHLGAGLLIGAMRGMKQKTDPEMYGGALLLGVNGICVITHGKSSQKAIFHAIRVTCESVHSHLNQTIVDRIAEMGVEA